ncbi:MAG: DUF2029 domain-containing protein [Anaerolineales bacterium]|nr:DUF2029 domain-containing protein [Anaerolineales bacterium]
MGFCFLYSSELAFIFLLLSYLLSLQFASKIGMKGLKGMLLVSAIYLFNVPVLRTLSFNQVNFYILVSILGVLILLHKYPFFVGIFISIGGMIKLYPFALSLPLLGMRKWRALIGIIAGIFALVFLRQSFFKILHFWKQFLNFYLFFPIEQESSLFRNTSPMSFLRSSIDLFNLPSSILSTLIIIVLLTIFFGM